jgi:hypothetical protein
MFYSTVPRMDIDEKQQDGSSPVSPLIRFLRVIFVPLLAKLLATVELG